MKAAGIAQNCHILVFFHGFRRGKDDLHVRKDDFDAVFFLFEFFEWASINGNVKEIISSIFDFFNE
jgi:hypothetical protein